MNPPIRLAASRTWRCSEWWATVNLGDIDHEPKRLLLLRIVAC
jgi:hypothetical protein